MKVEIELLNESNSYKVQMLAVDRYIKDNTIKVFKTDFLGITVSEEPVIKETNKNCGQKIEIEESYRKFHVSCKKTKGGIYKFKVWNAV